MLAKVEAGLPFFTGTFNVNHAIITESTGAFSYQSLGNSVWGNTDMGYSAKVSFDPSASNSIYGASNTVQPPAICLIPQIKF